MTYTSGQRSIMAEIISYYGHEPQKMMLLEEMNSRRRSARICAMILISRPSQKKWPM